jgi:hypothetical protein
VGDREVQVVDEGGQLLAGPGQQDAAAGVDDRAVGLGQAGDDGAGGLVVDRRSAQRLGVVIEPVEQRRVERLREDVHGNVDEDRAGLAALGQEERPLHDLGEQLGLVDPPGALHERAVDLVLRPVGVQVHLLVRVAAEVVRRHVAGDDHHGDAVERGVGDAGRGVGEPRAEVAEDDARPPGDPGIAVGRVGGDLLVADVDELDRAGGHGGQNGDVGVPAQPEDVSHPPPFQVGDELFGGRRMSGHHRPPMASAREPAAGGSGRRPGPW